MTTKPAVTENGRGVVVVASSFIIQAVVYGIASSIGLYNVEFLRTFDGSHAATSLVGSLNMGFLLGAGPITSGLLSRWSHRQVAIFGALLSSTGLTCMHFAPNLKSMYVFYGVLTGLGYNFLYMTTLIISGIYFPKRESLSTGIVAAGAGVGSAVFPIIVYNVIDCFGWRGSMFILAGINLNVVVLAALLKPPNVTKQLELHVDSPSDRLTNFDNKTANAENVYSIELGDETVTSVDRKQTIEQLPDETNDNKRKFIEGQRSKLKRPSKGLGKSISSTNVVYFSIYFVNNICWNAATGIATIFIPEYMIFKGLSKEDGSLGLVVIGVGTFLGSLCSGILGNTKWCNRMKLCTVWNYALAISFFLFLLPKFQTYIGLLILIFSVGFFYGAIIGQLVAITTDLMGPELTSIAYGILMFANGVGFSIGPPITGALIDAFGNSTLIVYTCGIFAAIGAFLVLPIPLHQTFTRQRKNKRVAVINSLVHSSKFFQRRTAIYHF